MSLGAINSKLLMPSSGQLSCSESVLAITTVSRVEVNPPGPIATAIRLNFDHKCLGRISSTHSISLFERLRPIGKISMRWVEFGGLLESHTPTPRDSVELCSARSKDDFFESKASVVFNFMWEAHVLGVNVAIVQNLLENLRMLEHPIPLQNYLWVNPGRLCEFLDALVLYQACR